MIPVQWLSYHKETPNKGYWDTGMLELIFEHKLYNLGLGYKFENMDVDAITAEYGGSVVVLPARYHTEDIDRLNSELAALPWVILIIANDEESIFPREKIKHPNMRMYVMTPRPQHDDKPADMFIGEGYPKNARDMIARQSGDKPMDFFFSGQITHSRRQEMAKQFAVIQEFTDVNKLAGVYYPTEGFGQGLDHRAYYKMMSLAKAVPAPSGPATPDSFRLYEALEAGAVPLADTNTPPEGGVTGYWEYMMPDAPFPIIKDWEELQGQLIAVRDMFPVLNNKVFAWWQHYKRKLVASIYDDIKALSGEDMTAAEPTDLITVIIPTSPIPSHPSTEMIEHTIADVRSQLPNAEIIIMIDGLREEQKDRADDYNEYIRRLLWLCNHEYQNVLPLLFDEHLHQAEGARLTMRYVRTPYVLYVEHDAPVTPDREIEWEQLIQILASGEANIIRLIHEELILPDYKHMMLDDQPQTVGGVPMVRTVQWSQRPHLATAAFYRWMLDTHFNPLSRTMIEDVMHGVVHAHYEREGEFAWNLWRLWIYCPKTDTLGIKRSYHLDGRGSDPKYDMIIKPVRDN